MTTTASTAHARENAPSGLSAPVAPETALIHHPYRAPQEFEGVMPAVYKASTVVFPDVHAARTRGWLDRSGYTYGLHGTPTTYTLEERLCALEGARHCLLLPSGLCAISTAMLALLNTGDEVLIPDNVYGPAKDFATHDLARLGIRHAVYDPMDVQDLRSKITAQTRLVWLEAAGSVTMEFPDLLAIVALCREHKLISVLDNTWGAGLAFAPFDMTGGGEAFGVDVCVHALTKYPSSGADVLMGSITTVDAALHSRIQMTHVRLGIGVGANDAELVLRALPSIALRYRAQDAAARRLGAAMQRQGAVAQLLHPAFANSPGHAHWQRLCAPEGQDGGAAGIFSVVFDPAQCSQASVDRFCDGLRLFRVGYSWGGPMSLVMPYDLSSMRQRPHPHVRSGPLVRLCVGLEDAADLERDLAQSYENAFGQPWRQGE